MSLPNYSCAYLHSAGALLERFWPAGAINIRVQGDLSTCTQEAAARTTFAQTKLKLV